MGETFDVAQERMDPVSPYIFFIFSSIDFRVRSLAISAGFRRSKPLESLLTTSVRVVARGGTIFLANETKLVVPLIIFSRVRKSSKLQTLLESNLMIAPKDSIEELVVFVVSNLSRKIVYSLVPLVYLRRKASEIVVFQSRKFPVESNMRQCEISR